MATAITRSSCPLPTVSVRITLGLVSRNRTASSSWARRSSSGSEMARPSNACMIAVANLPTLDDEEDELLGGDARLPQLLDHEVRLARVVEELGPPVAAGTSRRSQCCTSSSDTGKTGLRPRPHPISPVDNHSGDVTVPLAVSDDGGGAVCSARPRSSEHTVPVAPVRVRAVRPSTQAAATSSGSAMLPRRGWPTRSTTTGRTNSGRDRVARRAISSGSDHGGGPVEVVRSPGRFDLGGA